MTTKYKEIILENGLVKIRTIDYSALSEEQQNCYYEVHTIMEHDMITITKFICSFKYQTLSNQN